jgi:hypothetical protein
VNPKVTSRVTGQNRFPIRMKSCVLAGDTWLDGEIKQHEFSYDCHTSKAFHMIVILQN